MQLRQCSGVPESQSHATPPVLLKLLKIFNLKLFPGILIESSHQSNKKSLCRNCPMIQCLQNSPLEPLETSFEKKYYLKNRCTQQKKNSQRKRSVIEIFKC